MRSLRFAPLTAVIVFGLLATGCSAVVQPALAPLAPATATQFISPVSATLTAGSAGVEGTFPARYSWITSPIGRVTLTNNSHASSAIKLALLLKSPPCNVTPVKFQIEAGRQSLSGQVDAVGGQTFDVVVNVPIGKSAVVTIKVLSPSCRYESDPRDLYLGVFNIAAS